MSKKLSALIVPILLINAIGELQAQLPGAIWTTDHRAEQVNGNIYSQKSKVYFNGGPGPNSCVGSSLPDGLYYFQVTNPSGSVLLSEDDISDRMVEFFGGFIIGTGTTGTHAIKNGACHGGGTTAKIVQLVPFLDTPNRGGEYKVWLTPVGAYAPGAGFHGFLARFSKTDNFKVKNTRGRTTAQTVITGRKYYDYDEDQIFDEGTLFEVPIPGWRIEITGGGQTDITYTDMDGRYTFIRPDDGSIYVIQEVAPPPGFIPNPGATWYATTPTSGTVVATGPALDGPDFGNISFGLAPDSRAGLSHGFWHSNNAMAILSTPGNDPLWRELLNDPTVCLTQAPADIATLGPIYTVPEYPTHDFNYAFNSFSGWIVGNGVYGNAGYNVSTQLAAVYLNWEFQFAEGTILIDAHLDGALVPLTDILADVSLLLCHPNAALTGPNEIGADPILSPAPGNPSISLREALLSWNGVLDAINNTSSGNTMIYEKSEAPAPFVSPY